MIMNKTLLCTTFASIVVGSVNCFADQGIPDLVGQWEGHGEFAKILRKEAPTLKSHVTYNEFGSLAIDYRFTEQKGRLLKGTKTSPSKTEKVVCAIGYDNKSIHCTDEDGAENGQIVNDHEIIVYYQHINEDYSVVSEAKLMKKK
jgi:hypothetical protein